MSRYKSQSKAVLRILRSAVVELGCARWCRCRWAAAGGDGWSTAICRRRLHRKDETAFRYLVTATAVLPFEITFSSWFLPTAYSHANRLVYNYASTGVHLNYSIYRPENWCSYDSSRCFISLFRKLEMFTFNTALTLVFVIHAMISITTLYALVPFHNFNSSTRKEWFCWSKNQI